MASGHVNRIKRPNTWLHRPMLQNVKKALANPEPSTHGTFRTCRRTVKMSVYRGRRNRRYVATGRQQDRRGTDPQDCARPITGDEMPEPE